MWDRLFTLIRRGDADSGSNGDRKGFIGDCWAEDELDEGNWRVLVEALLFDGSMSGVGCD